MKKVQLIFFLIAFCKSSNCQNSLTWLNYLKTIKEQFYLKDSIAFKFGTIPDTSFGVLFKPVRDKDCHKLFTLVNDLQNCGQKYPNKFFYSYLISKYNYAALTFLSFGKYSPVLTLYNYDPEGNLIQQIEVKSDFFDAGQADSTIAYFMNKSNFVVKRWDGFEIDNGNIVDSVTTTTYTIDRTGKIMKGTRSIDSRVRR